MRNKSMDFLTKEERDITNILISIICLYGNNGIPLGNIDEEFIIYCGYPIPYQKFGYKTLKSFIVTLPEIYIIKDGDNNDILIEQSKKSSHIKELILKQKPNKSNNKHPRYTTFKRKLSFETSSEARYGKNGRYEKSTVPEGSFIHTSIHEKSSDSENRFHNFEQLESMLPIFYKHQALGDDFLLDIADTKMGCYVPERGPKYCGLCSAGQTISELTQKVKNAVHLAPRVVVMIGFHDLLWDTNVNTMIYNLRQLVIELKKKNARVTLITLIPSPKMPKMRRLQARMNIFNSAILDYAVDNELQCNVIDMNTIFDKEMQAFRRDFDRFKKVAKKDPYKVFSDYGRKIFLAALKSCLREQIEAGH